MSMEIILLVIIVLQFSYIFYKDYSFNIEREKMFLKIMSKDIREYKGAIEKPTEESTVQVENEYIPIEEATLEEILKADNKL